MNPFEMVAIIVVTVMIASVLRAKYSHRRRGEVESDPAAKVETLRLQDEVKQLKERIHVLERIATDKESTLSRQIEELRDRK